MLYGDYLWHAFDLFKVEEGWLPLYYGIGGRLELVERGDDHVGIRVPVGLSYIFPSRRVDLFMEIVPRLDLTPDTNFDTGGAIGARYYFTRP